MKNEWKMWVIDFIDYISEKLYHEDYKKELNSIRNKYIFKDISHKDFITDIKRLKQIKEVCEYKTQFFYEN
jgi:NADPH-dependent 7-cyano-7-deazaguanine reductase QueF